MDPVTTIAIVHAPGKTSSHIRGIWNALVADAGQSGIRLDEVHINPAQSELGNLKQKPGPTQLILVWGLDTRPNWSELVLRYCPEAEVVHLVAMTQAGLACSRVSRLWRPLRSVSSNGVVTQKRNRMENFMAGFFNGRPPYGYRRAYLPDSRPRIARGGPIKGSYTLEPGEPEKVAVVQYIFDAFVDGDLTRTQILQALIAARVEPPPDAKRWTHGTITRILSDPVYIGTNKHIGYYRNDVFPPIISKARFHQAQALLVQNASQGADFVKLHATADIVTEGHEEQ